jgi:HSP20 family protein
MANKDKSKKSMVSTPPQSLSSFEDMERWFDEFLPSHFMHPFNHNWPAWPNLDIQTKGRFPKVDVIDKDTEILIRAELPGVKKEDLDISLQDDILTIKASSRNEKEEEEGEYHRREISRGEFQRTMTLPSAIVGDKAKSSFKNGVLELTIPKEKLTKRKTIKIE